MKKIILLSTLFASFLSYSQENQKVDFKKNEIKLNALYLVLGAFEGTYERAINEESSFGCSLTFLLDNNDADINTAFALSPYYRFYFGKKPVSGFYMEGFALYENVNRDNYYYNTEGFEVSIEEKINAFSLGIGLGGKWYTKRNVMFEIGGGIGRNLSISSNIPNTDYSKITGKISIGVGYRF